MHEVANSQLKRAPNKKEDHNLEDENIQGGKDSGGGMKTQSGNAEQ
jgi:hypothetical protein